MPPAPVPPGEAERLRSLRACGLLDTPPDPRLDAIVRLAAHFYDVPAAFVSLVDERCQWVKSAAGCIVQPGSETPRDVAFCAHTIGQPDQPLVVDDATKDARFSNNPLVTGEPGLRFYAGAPLRDSEGRALGALCIADTRPRHLSPGEVETLRDLALGISSILDPCCSVAALSESEEYDQLPWTADPTGEILSVSPRLAAFTGLSRETLAGAGWTRIVHPDDVAHALQRWSQCLGSGEPFDVEQRLRAVDGTYRWFRTYAAPRRDRDGTVLRWYGTAEDIHDSKEELARIAYMAYYDGLTGLANRGLFRELLEHHAVQLRYGRRLAVLSINIDHFKAVNDAFGHRAGDTLLQQVAGRLRACVREADAVARFESDEFFVLQTELVQPDDAAALSERVARVLSGPFDLEGNSVTVGASIGIALAPDDGEQADTLLHNVRLALLHAKAGGRGGHRFFDTEMGRRTQGRRALVLDLRGALGRGELALAYQPILDLRSGRIASFEALLRWYHPRRGVVPPEEFIPLAEKSGLIIPIGEWSLRQACREAARWPSDVGIAVNLSSIQFRDGALSEMVGAALTSAALAPNRLELEITESVLLLDDEANLATLRELRQLGVRIAMDDFGTGYSSLGYLRQFPFDKLKIDRSFVANLPESREDRLIVRAVVGLSRAFGITTTAEGVETPQQRDWLRDEGCDQAQGYLLGRAAPASEVPALIGGFRG